MSGADARRAKGVSHARRARRLAGTDPRAAKWHLRRARAYFGSAAGTGAASGSGSAPQMRVCCLCQKSDAAVLPMGCGCVDRAAQKYGGVVLVLRMPRRVYGEVQEAHGEKVARHQRPDEGRLRRRVLRGGGQLRRRSRLGRGGAVLYESALRDARRRGAGRRAVPRGHCQHREGDARPRRTKPRAPKPS